jgi:pimeloyl-ACP methyl ester carboxylesterase
LGGAAVGIRGPACCGPGRLAAEAASACASGRAPEPAKCASQRRGGPDVEHRPAGRYARGLARGARLPRWSWCGCSDRLPSGASYLDEWMFDVVGVLDEVGSERVALVGIDAASPMALIVAATFPDRVSALVLFEAYARLTRAPGYEIGYDFDIAELAKDHAYEHWGDGTGGPLLNPDIAGDPYLVDLYARLERAAMSRTEAAEAISAWMNIDVREFLPSVRTPALLFHASLAGPRRSRAQAEDHRGRTRGPADPRPARCRRPQQGDRHLVGWARLITPTRGRRRARCHRYRAPCRHRPQALRPVSHHGHLAVIAHRRFAMWRTSGPSASLEAVETVVAVAADLRLAMTGWPRDPEGCLRLWPVRGPGHHLESSAGAHDGWPAGMPVLVGRGAGQPLMTLDAAASPLGLARLWR